MVFRETNPMEFTDSVPHVTHKFWDKFEEEEKELNIKIVVDKLLKNKK